MTLSVTGDEFFLVTLPNGKTIHETEDDAVDYLKEQAKNLDPKSDDISLLRISIEGEDWTIAEMSWQNIALRLMGGD